MAYKPQFEERRKGMGERRKEEIDIQKQDINSDTEKPAQVRPDYYPYNQPWLDYMFE